MDWIAAAITGFLLLIEAATLAVEPPRLPTSGNVSITAPLRAPQTEIIEP